MCGQFTEITDLRNDGSVCAEIDQLFCERKDCVRAIYALAC